MDFARRMAETKAAAGLDSLVAGGPPSFVLASDTVVTVDGVILGKPVDDREAVEMLHRLSGRPHTVVTAWSLAWTDDSVVEHAATEVHFRPLGEREVAEYVATGEAQDKAGAYGIQGAAGDFVCGLRGSYDTVVGLPLAPVLEALVRHGVVTFPSALAHRAALVRGRLAAASAGAPVTLVGASKAQPVPSLRDAVACGVVDLGESYVQEWRGKSTEVSGARWHFIGHLQRNKAKHLGAGIAVAHGLDSARTIEALARSASRHGRVIDALVQVNAAGEASKGGVEPAGVPELLDLLDGADGLRPVGLMTLPPRQGPAAARARFMELRRLRDALATEARPLPELSMGMSGDYEIAAACGATMVRVGTALFGPRVPTSGAR